MTGLLLFGSRRFVPFSSSCLVISDCRSIVMSIHHLITSFVLIMATRRWLASSEQCQGRWTSFLVSPLPLSWATDFASRTYDGIQNIRIVHSCSYCNRICYQPSVRRHIHTYIHMHTIIHANTYTHTHTNTHTFTHTHTHSLAEIKGFCFSCFMLFCFTLDDLKLFVCLFEI